MHSLGINDGELRWQPANRGSPGKMAFKTVCVSEVISWKRFLSCLCHVNFTILFLGRELCLYHKQSRLDDFLLSACALHLYLCTLQCTYHCHDEPVPISVINILKFGIPRGSKETVQWQQLFYIPWQSSSNCAQPLSDFLSSGCGCITTLLLDWMTCWTMGADCFRIPGSCFSEVCKEVSCSK